MAKHKFSCLFCEIIFYSWRQRFTHINASHKNEAKEAGWLCCQICDQYFRTTSLLARHNNSAHKNVQSESNTTEKDSLDHIEVDTPQVSDKNAKQLDSSVKRSTDALTCFFCGLDFPSLQSINSHVNEEHKSEAKEVGWQCCQICDKYLPTKHGLMIHRSKVHQSVVESRSTATKKAKKKRKKTQRGTMEKEPMTESHPDELDKDFEDAIMARIPNEILDKYDIILESKSEILGNPQRFHFPRKGPYLCQICLEVFNYRADFLDHVTNNHEEDSVDQTVMSVMLSRASHLESSDESETASNAGEAEQASSEVDDGYTLEPIEYDVESKNSVGTSIDTELNDVNSEAKHLIEPTDSAENCTEDECSISTSINTQVELMDSAEITAENNNLITPNVDSNLNDLPLDVNDVVTEDELECATLIDCTDAILHEDVPCHTAVKATGTKIRKRRKKKKIFFGSTKTIRKCREKKKMLSRTSQEPNEIRSKDDLSLEDSESLVVHGEHGAGQLKNVQDLNRNHQQIQGHPDQAAVEFKVSENEPISLISKRGRKRFTKSETEEIIRKAETDTGIKVPKKRGRHSNVQAAVEHSGDEVEQKADVATCESKESRLEMSRRTTQEEKLDPTVSDLQEQSLKNELSNTNVVENSHDQDVRSTEPRKTAIKRDRKPKPGPKIRTNEPIDEENIPQNKKREVASQ